MLLKRIELLFLLILFFDGLCFSQTLTNSNSIDLTITIEPNDSTVVDSSGYKFIDYYKANNLSNPGEFSLPQKHIVVAIPSYSNPKLNYKVIKSSTIEDAVPLTNSAIFRLNDSTLIQKKTKLSNAIQLYKNQPIVQLGKKFWLRDFYCLEIIINSHQYNLNKKSITINKNIEIKIGFDKVYSISTNSPIKAKTKYDQILSHLIYNSGMAEQFRTFNPVEKISVTDDWINYDQDYIKLALAKDGVYRITDEDLSSLGVPINSIDPRQFQLFESGIEHEIFVKGEDDRSFDQDDFIEFYGSKNYSKTDYHLINDDDEPYNTYLNRYTDTTYYFLTWGRKNGKRYKEDSSTVEIGLNKLLYHNAFRHYEINSFYQNCDNNEIANQTSNWNKNKNWYWGFIFEGTKNFSVKLDHLYNYGNANVFAKLTSFASNLSKNSHQVVLRFNDTIIDSQNVDRFHQFLLNGSISTEKLNKNSNTLSIQNVANASVVNSLLYDWYEIEYPRSNVLANDSLIIEIPEGFSNNEMFMQFSNANSDSYSIYKIRPSKKHILSYSVENGDLTFRDTISTGDKYILIGSERISSPSINYLGKFKNLRNEKSQADYLAITSTRFNNSVASYINSISELFDLSTKEIFVEDIYNEFGYGYPTPNAIKDFVIDAYNNWSSPKLSYLVLIGDATYDYKGYVFDRTGVKLSQNYVPAYGYPISDNWYAIWNDEIPIPQLKVGRIPILSNIQLQNYLAKVQNNIQTNDGSWNKRYLLFSGGNASNGSEIKQLKAANDSVIVKIIEPRPISGNYYHFFKTTDPLSDFGPYSAEEFNKAVDKGGLFISYVGHSGTSTWDNSINNISQLKNSTNVNPVISDFGCSTNKFGEPDIVCFGESFLLDDEGQALNYIGNSSLGFISTAIPAPTYFYESFKYDSIREVGNAHVYAKSKLFEIFGGSGVNKVFSLSNTILGDPVVRLRLPTKPNLLFEDNPILFEATKIDDSADSIKINIIVTNWGLAPSIQYNINIKHYYKNDLIETKNLMSIIPGFKDTLNFWIQTKDLAGDHRLELSLDSDGQITELNEEDNSFNYVFTVYSSALKDLLLYTRLNGNIKKLIILNPVLESDTVSEILLQIDSDKEFTNPSEYKLNTDKLFTEFTGLSFSNDRFWLRYKLNSDQAKFSTKKSFTSEFGYDYVVNDQFSFANQTTEKIVINQDSIEITTDTLNISVLSAGTYAGATCVIAENSINILDNNYFTGMGIAVYDPKTMVADTVAWFQLFGNLANAQALAEMIYNIPEGKIVVLGVSDDGQHKLKASGLNTAIKTLGSSLIDQLKFQGSWAIIGRKGASPGDPDIIEDIKGPYDGSVYLEKDYIVPSPSGYLSTTQLGPVSRWDSLYVNYTIPDGAAIDVTPIGIMKGGEIDTLSTFPIETEKTSLSFVDADEYPYAKLSFKLTRNSEHESPTISQIGVNHQNAAELAINYQTASITKDTVIVTDSIGINFKISNVGEGTASNVRSKVDLYKNNIFVKNVFDSTLSALNSDSAQDIDLNYTALLEDGLGNFKFVIELDADDNVVELYEDNNKFELPFVVKDTVTSISSAIVMANFDGYEIYDGDYVSHNPKVDILLDYEGNFELSDTNSIEILLNQKRISFASLNTTYETQNRRVVFSFNPDLEDGDYTLSVLGDNIHPAHSEKNTFVRFFKVSSESKILYPFNYPNPFANETHFTFKLTQVPDELKIKIFTIAGRLVREIKVSREELNFDFNRISWDGRDEDGDLLANGVYLYKVISYDSDKTVSVTSKIAIVR